MKLVMMQTRTLEGKKLTVCMEHTGGQPDEGVVPEGHVHWSALHLFLGWAVANHMPSWLRLLHPHCGQKLQHPYIYANDPRSVSV